MAVLHNSYPSYSHGVGRVYMEFYFAANGAAAPLITGVTQQMQCMLSATTPFARTGTGVIVVTMRDPWIEVISKTAEVDDSLNDGSYATMGNVTNAGTSTPLQFTVYTRSAAGASADLAAGRLVQVTLAFRNSAGK